MASAASAQTTWVVNGTGDASGTTVCASSPCSTLRSAIYAANNITSAAVIDLSGLSGTIDLTSSLPGITNSNVTIIGPGASALTISGQGQYQIFNAPNFTTLAVSGLTLADGNAGGGSGGAIFSTVVTAANCTFIGNSAPARSGAGGGAIRAGILTVTNSTFTDNSSYDPGGAIEDVIPKGTITIANSTFTGNSSASFGGAIRQTGPLTVTNSTFSGNSSPDGGAVYWYGLNFTMTVTNSTFTGNSASGQSLSGGGAIYWFGKTTATLTVTNSIFSGNSAPSGSGGGIYDRYGGAVTEGNNLYYGDTGGDIIVAGAPQGLSSSDVTGSNPSLTPLGNFGGPTETMMPEPGSAAICNGNAADLTAALTAAHGVDSNISVTADQRGFPIAPTVGACANSNVDIGAVQTNYLLVTSTSPSSGTTGSLPYQVSVANGQPYTDIGFSPTLSGGSPTITLSNYLSLSQGSTVVIGPPDAVTISGGTVSQIFQVYGSTDTLYGLTMTDGNDNRVDGGAIRNSSGTLTVINGTFSDNVSSGQNGGGAIYNSSGTLTVTNSTFYNNSATGSGSGGAINAVGNLSVTNSTFDGNSAAQGGGAIFGQDGGVFVDSIFDGNSAAQGGGVANSSGATTENNNLFYGNYLTGSPTTESDAYGFTLNKSGTDVIGLDANLATLGNYGGPTQTMLPLPGSAAICAGTPILPFGLMLPSTDQRGFSRTTTYTVNSSPLTCVDIGAVETNYQSIQFTNVPTSGAYTEIAGQAVNPPAPIVSVTESGQTIPGVSVTLNVGSLTGVTGNVETTQGTLGSAAASFGQLTVPLADVGNTYTLSSTLDLFTPKGATTPVSITTNPTANLDVLSVTGYVAYLGSIGTLTSGQVNSLTKEWDKAISMGSDGKFSGAINNLNDFIAEVNDLLSSGVLTQAEANALINAANYQISLYEQG